MAVYHGQTRHGEHDDQGLDDIRHAGGHARGCLHGGGAHPQRREEDGHQNGCQGMQLGDQGHGHAVEAVAGGEAVDQAVLGTQQLGAAAQTRDDTETTKLKRMYRFTAKPLNSAAVMFSPTARSWKPLEV